MSRIDECYYEFQTINFPVFPYIVTSFVFFIIPGRKKNWIFILIYLKKSLVKAETKMQYLVIVDTEKLKAYECSVDEDGRQNKF